jgi:hypothetical protein
VYHVHLNLVAWGAAVVPAYKGALPRGRSGRCVELDLLVVLKAGQRCLYFVSVCTRNDPHQIGMRYIVCTLTPKESSLKCRWVSWCCMLHMQRNLDECNKLVCCDAPRTRWSIGWCDQPLLPPPPAPPPLPSDAAEKLPSTRIVCYWVIVLKAIFAYRLLHVVDC